MKIMDMTPMYENGRIAYTLEANCETLATFSVFDDALENAPKLFSMYNQLLDATGEDLWGPAESPAICVWEVRDKIVKEGVEEYKIAEKMRLIRVYNMDGSIRYDVQNGTEVLTKALWDICGYRSVVVAPDNERAK